MNIGLFLLLPLAAGIDIADPIFDKSWISEVPTVETLTPGELWNTFYNTSTPLKTKLSSLLDVQARWTNEYLLDKFGDVLVRTEPDRENRTTDYCGLVRLGEKINCNREDYAKMKHLKVYYTFRDFINNMTTYGDDFHRYVIGMLPDSMAAELPFLPGFSCGYRRAYYPLDNPPDELAVTQIAEMNFWFSKGSTYSAVHYDMNQQIMCQIDGHKEWRFWDLRTELPHIPMWSGFYPETLQSDDMPIDPLDVDLEKYPDFVNAKWTNTTLSPGECLLIPSRHALHFVRGFKGERNIGFSIHVHSEMKEKQFYDCDATVSNITHSNLGDFNVLWPFPGDPRETEYNIVRMGYVDWKDLAVFAIRRMHQDRTLTLERVIGEITNGRSDRSKRIAALLNDEEVESRDALRIFNFGPLWREVYFLRNK